MRLVLIALLTLAGLAGPTRAQDGGNAPPETAGQGSTADDGKAAEIAAMREEARKRQHSSDRQTLDLMGRWLHAVCVGCGPEPKGFRRVHTYPHRVLQGIPAAEDDLRERRGQRI